MSARVRDGGSTVQPVCLAHIVVMIRLGKRVLRAPSSLVVFLIPPSIKAVPTGNLERIG